MRTTNSFSITFFIKKDKVSKGYAPMFARITVNGEFTDVSLQRRVLIKAWNQPEQKLAGNDDEATDIREKMRQKTKEINDAYDHLKYHKKLITPHTIKARVQGFDEESVSLLWLINYHNTEIGMLLEPGTLKNYFSTQRFIKEFLAKKRIPDLSLSELNFKFLVEFQIFLLRREPDKGQKKCTNNTVMKHIERLRKIVNFAVKSDWLIKDPFIKFKRHMITKDRECLEAEELQCLHELELDKEVLRINRDKFVFSCYTGLAFADIDRFSEEHIKKDADGEQWIEMVRKKTENFSEIKFTVLLLPEAIELIDKYREHPRANVSGTIFPPYCNQATNRYLKDIANEMNLNRDLTFHLARHTFATTVTLENGVPIESVSRMLAIPVSVQHKSIQR